MNPALSSAQPQPLYGPCMHAGGWPKLGWETIEADVLELADDGTPLDDDAMPRAMS